MSSVVGAAGATAAVLPDENEDEKKFYGPTKRFSQREPIKVTSMIQADETKSIGEGIILLYITFQPLIIIYFV